MKKELRFHFLVWLLTITSILVILSFRPVQAQDYSYTNTSAVTFGLLIEGTNDSNFTECIGIGSENEIVEQKVTGPNGQQIIRKIPGRLTWNSIILKRAISNNKDMWTWRKQVEDGNVTNARKNVSIIMYNNANQKIAKWNLTNAWPCRISTSIASNGQITEEIELASEKIERVSAVSAYSIAPIDNQIMSELTEGYAAGTQEEKNITITKTGTEDLASLATALSGNDADDFEITQPVAAALNAGNLSTDFTVKAKDGLAAGTYTAFVTISAANMDDVSFTITQAVSAEPVINAIISPTEISFDLNAPADPSTAISWNSAQSVTDVVYASTALAEGTDYNVNGDTLTIAKDYISGLNLTAGDSADFEISFDKGKGTVLTVDIVNGYVPGADAVIKELKVGGSIIDGFAPDKYVYDIELPYETQPDSAAAAVSAEPRDPKASVAITQATALPGSTIVDVTAEDGTTKLSYTVNITLAAPPVTLENIAITNPPAKTTYAIGEKLELAGLIITGTYSDKSTALLTITAANISGFDSSAAELGQVVTVTYEGRTAFFTVDIAAIPTYTVAFNKNGGNTDAIPTTKRVVAGENVGTLPTAPTRAGYTFSSWNTAANGRGTRFTASTTVNANITVYAQWKVIINHYGGQSGTDILNPAPEPFKPITCKLYEDGNTIIIVTTSAAETNPATGIASFKVDPGIMTNLTDMLKQREKNGLKPVAEIKVEAPANVRTVAVEIPRKAFDEMANTTWAELKVNAGFGTITFDAKAVDTISAAAAGDITINITKVAAAALSQEMQNKIGDRPVYSFSVKAGTTEISGFDGGIVHISIPYTPKAGENPNAIVIYYLGSKGQLNPVQGKYDPSTGTVDFTTRHFSQYVIGYNEVKFNDVAETAWYSNAVGFVAARCIATGTGNGNYSPEMKLTRGQFMTMVMRAYGIDPDENPTDNFADADKTYYTNYLAAAKRLGLSSGIGSNLFAPDQEITRQEMFTLLYNALKIVGALPEGTAGKELTDFNDSDQIAPWAQNAMTLFVGTGIISGSGGKLSPTDTTNRSQMAQVLYNLL